MAANKTVLIPEDHAIMAIPKKGRLNEKTMKLLNGAGLEFVRPERVDVAVCSNLPVTLVFLPASDIATFVSEGNVDLGITGLDHVEETGAVVEKLINLGFGKCSLAVQAPVVSEISGPEALVGMRIATSFPRITRQFFNELNPDVETGIRFLSGSVESACGLGLADAVVDLVETGTTMRAAGLEKIHDVMITEAALLANPQSTHKETIGLLQRRIQGYLTATRFVLMSYNVSRELLAGAIAITPGKRSPTVSPLEDENSCAVSVLVEKKGMSDVMDRLEALGATDILVTTIQNSRM